MIQILLCHGWGWMNYKSEAAEHSCVSPIFSIYSAPKGSLFLKTCPKQVTKGSGVQSTDEAQVMWYIEEPLAKFLCQSSPRISVFYICCGTTAPPRHPIMSSFASILEPLAQFLQSQVQATRSYIKDTKYLIWKIEVIILPKEATLVTMDVNNLFIFIWVNNIYEHIKFSCKSHPNIIALLETVNFRDHNNHLAVCPFTKPTDKNSLLNLNSCNPWHLRENIPVGQFLQLEKNCSLNSDYQKESNWNKCKGYILTI